jgi:hypothetical protein
MVPQQNTAFSVQATYHLNAKFITRATYDEPRKICPQRAQPTKMQANKLREPPPVPYIPKKDKVQEEVTKLQNLQI